VGTTREVRAVRPGVPAVDFSNIFGMDGEEFEQGFSESFQTGGFWTLIHPSIREEVSGRFTIKEYADAVMAALQVVAQTVRDKTGLRDDGARLMGNAFGGDSPYLVFEDPMPLTQQAMQTGYQQLFAGAMTGVRNPKAHSLVTIDRPAASTSCFCVAHGVQTRRCYVIRREP
jgi:uncharacterized protein (TIGR02391 family)